VISGAHYECKINEIRKHKIPKWQSKTPLLFYITDEALSQVVSVIKAVHIINSRMLLLNEPCATGCGGGGGQRARCLHDVRLISGVSL